MASTVSLHDPVIARAVLDNLARDTQSPISQYHAFSASLAHEKQLRENRNRIKFDVQVCLSRKQQELLERLVENYDLNFVGTSSSSHPMANAIRDILTHKIFGSLNQHEVIIDAGSNWLTLYRQGRDNVHACCPLLDVRDSQRHTERMYKLRILKDRHVDNPIESSRLTKFISEFDKKVCQMPAQMCKVPGTAMVMIESIYDWSLPEIARAMDSHGCEIAYATMMFCPTMFHEQSGEIPEIGVRWHIVDDEKKVSAPGLSVFSRRSKVIEFFFENDSEWSYRHDYDNLIRTATQHTVRTVDNHYSIQRRKDCGVYVLTFTKLATSFSPQSFLDARYWYDLSKSLTKVRVLDVVVKGRLVLSNCVKPRHILVPATLWEKGVQYAMSLAGKDNALTPNVIYSMLRSMNVRTVVNGVEVSSDMSLNSEDLYALSFTMFFVAFKRSYEQSITSAFVVDRELRLRTLRSKGMTELLWTTAVMACQDFAGVKLDDKNSGIFENFNDSLRSAIYKRVMDSTSIPEPGAEDEPEFVVYSEVVDSIISKYQPSHGDAGEYSMYCDAVVTAAEGPALKKLADNLASRLRIMEPEGKEFVEMRSALTTVLRKLLSVDQKAVDMLTGSWSTRENLESIVDKIYPFHASGAYPLAWQKTAVSTPQPKTTSSTTTSESQDGDDQTSDSTSEKNDPLSPSDTIPTPISPSPVILDQHWYQRLDFKCDDLGGNATAERCLHEMIDNGVEIVDVSGAGGLCGARALTRSFESLKVPLGEKFVLSTLQSMFYGASDLDRASGKFSLDWFSNDALAAVCKIAKVRFSVVVAIGGAKRRDRTAAAFHYEDYTPSDLPLHAPHVVLLNNPNNHWYAVVPARPGKRADWRYKCKKRPEPDPPHEVELTTTTTFHPPLAVRETPSRLPRIEEEVEEVWEPLLFEESRTFPDREREQMPELQRFVTLSGGGKNPWPRRTFGLLGMCTLGFPVYRSFGLTIPISFPIVQSRAHSVMASWFQTFTQQCFRALRSVFPSSTFIDRKFSKCISYDGRYLRQLLADHNRSYASELVSISKDTKTGQSLLALSDFWSEGALNLDETSPTTLFNGYFFHSGTPISYTSSPSSHHLALISYEQYGPDYLFRPGLSLSWRGLFECYDYKRFMTILVTAGAVAVSAKFVYNAFTRYYDEWSDFDGSLNYTPPTTFYGLFEKHKAIFSSTASGMFSFSWDLGFFSYMRYQKIDRVSISRVVEEKNDREGPAQQFMDEYETFAINNKLSRPSGDLDGFSGAHRTSVDRVAGWLNQASSETDKEKNLKKLISEKRFGKNEMNACPRPPEIDPFLKTQQKIELKKQFKNLKNKNSPSSGSSYVSFSSGSSQTSDTETPPPPILSTSSSSTDQNYVDKLREKQDVDNFDSEQKKKHDSLSANLVNYLDYLCTEVSEFEDAVRAAYRDKMNYDSIQIGSVRKYRRFALDQVYICKQVRPGIYEKPRDFDATDLRTAFDPMADNPSDEQNPGLFVEASYKKGEIRAETNSPVIVVGGFFAVALCYIELAAVNKRGYIRPVAARKYIIEDGVPGCGKTQSALMSMKKGDLYFTSGRSAAADARERATTMGIDPDAIRTIGSAIINGCQQTHTIYVDEAIMCHPGQLVYLAELCGAALIKCYGDTMQIPFIPRVGDRGRPFRLPQDETGKPIPLPWEVTHVSVSKTLCQDVAVVLRPFYKQGLITTNPVTRSVRVHIVAADSNTPKSNDWQYLTFTRSQRDKLKTLGYSNAKTINEFQGNRHQRVRVVRGEKNLDEDLRRSVSQAIVALSRHTEEFEYYTVEQLPQMRDELFKLATAAEKIENVVRAHGAYENDRSDKV